MASLKVFYLCGKKFEIGRQRCMVSVLLELRNIGKKTIGPDVAGDSTECGHGQG